MENTERIFENIVTEEELNKAAAAAISALKEKGLVLGTAESCTGGLLAKLLTDVSGASEVFHCGVVSYSNEIKNSVLGVRDETLAAFGAVSRETAEEMAKGVMRLSGSDCSVSVTGMAGPTSDEPGKPVGLIWICAASRDKIKTIKLLNCFTEDVRRRNRYSAALAALELIPEIIAEH